MPRDGEKWFKGMGIEATFCNQFLKPEFKDETLSIGVPMAHIQDQFYQFLKILQKHFTCEWRFTMVYHYHIKLLMHFTGKKVMNMSFYLHRILGKMAYKVQGKKQNFENSLFHFGLIKLLVLEELKKKDLYWECFVL